MGRDLHEAKRKPEKFQMQGPRIWIPLEVLQSKAWAGLSFAGKALLTDLSGQLRARHGEIYNNGDLTTALKVLEDLGWTRRGTVARAALELEDAGLICRTRQGRLPNVATLYAVTWLPLNESVKLDISARGFPFKAYLLSTAPSAPKRVVEDEIRPSPLSTRTENVLAAG